ncbi:MAG: hypothetical protein Tsb004_21740 [Allomuricauda sp.]
MVPKSKSKIQYDVLSSAFLKELSKKKSISSEEKSQIKVDTESDKIAEIIAKKLLDSVEKKVRL